MQMTGDGLLNLGPGYGDQPVSGDADGTIEFGAGRRRSGRAHGDDRSISAVITRPQRSALPQPDANRSPTTSADREARLVPFPHTQEIFPVWKPLAHSALGVGDEGDIILGVGSGE